MLLGLLLMKRLGSGIEAAGTWAAVRWFICVMKSCSSGAL